MKYKDESGQWKDLVLPATGDTLPVGTVVEFEGDTVPSNWTKVEENEAYKSLLNLLCPIGKIEIFFDNNDHSNHLGFTWERTLIGRVPVGINSNDDAFNAIGKTGGEKTHTLTVSEMPTHKHRNENHMVTADAPGYGNWISNVRTGTEAYAGYIASADTSEVGGNQPHNILQPYEVVAFWKRVS